MIPRSMAMAGALGAAVGGPYLLSQSGALAPPSQPPAAQQALGQEGEPAGTLNPPSVSSPEGPGAAIYRSPAPLEGFPGRPLEAVLRWDVTKDSVYADWARKTTGLADPTLFGVRVPLVTGTRVTDVAGSLAYYFDAGGVLERIRFHGRTADTTSIVRLAIERFGMQWRQPLSPGDQLLQAIEGDRIRGELRTRPESTLWATTPHVSFLVDLELNRPGGAYWVAPQTPTLRLAGQGGATGETVSAKGAPAKPVLPARSIVPDASKAQSVEPTPSAEAAKPATPSPSAKFDAHDAVGENIKPLENYRDRFRWPN